eukprot:7913973-Pyramimonas_sp.AAC.1
MSATGSLALIRDEGHGRAHLAATLAKTSALIVLDDCWHQAHAELFVTLPQELIGRVYLHMSQKSAH